MIKNIEDLKNYMKEDANEFKEEIYKTGFLIYHDGINIKQLESLHKALPYLPLSYIQELTKYNIFQVAVGYFSISPINWDTDNIVDSLIRAQSTEESFLPRTLLDPLDLYWIGNNNNDTIYVVGCNSPCYKEGEIVAIHEFILSAKAEEDPASYRLLLAKNFEQFLIIAGNLNEVHRMQLEPEQSKLEMQTRLKTLRVDEKYHEAWFEYL